MVQVYFFIATWVVGGGTGCDCGLEAPKFALTVKTITSGFTALGSSGVAAAVPEVCVGCLASSLVISMLRLLNRLLENSRLCPNFVTEYSFGDSPLMVISPSLFSMLVRYRPGTASK